jgi:carbamoyl-phosphate synthase small subunit
VVGLAEIDTRALVRRIRQQGAMKGVLSTEDMDEVCLVAKAQASPGLVGRDLVREVVPSGPRHWEEPLAAGFPGGTGRDPSNVDCELHVVALDYGMKWNIARHLREVGCRVTILPGTASAREVLQLNPDGVFLSNGPGDPEPVGYAIAAIREILPRVPVFGVCLGHQFLGLACGAQTYKLKFGHRGANQPVLCCQTGRVEMTAQNHGFAVCEETLPEMLEITHRNLNDNSIAGLRHRSLPAFSVQYHPEASAGPHDSEYLFAQFRDTMRRGRRG